MQRSPKFHATRLLQHRLWITCLSLAALLGAIDRVTAVRASDIDSDSNSTTWRDGSFPVEDFITYTSPFGYRGSDFHYGLDLAAPEGSYVRSWWSGRVVEVLDDGRCGTGLVIESGGWEHIYCHMVGYASETRDGKRYLIDREGGVQIMEGQEIPTAARIGRVGMTGRTTGPHLHWGLRYNGEWVDPALVLQAMYEDQTASADVR